MGVTHVLICFSCLLAYGKTGKVQLPIVKEPARTELQLPPQACFEPFNWNDCGRPPVHVLYYYKPGSRCEVAIWRGCLPNLNMFKDEYECVNTCIYAERAHPDDFHMSGHIEIDDMAEYENANENGTEISITTTDATSDSANVNSTTDAVTIDGVDSKTDSKTESGSIDVTNPNTDSVIEIESSTDEHNNDKQSENNEKKDE